MCFLHGHLFATVKLSIRLVNQRELLFAESNGIYDLFFVVHIGIPILKYDDSAPKRLSSRAVCDPFRPNFDPEL